MSGRLNLALAVIALQHGNKDECLNYMAKAAEFGDDLNSFVSEIIKPPPRAVRNDGAVPQSENTISPSLAATDFISVSSRVGRCMAIAASLDDGDELEFEPSDESFDIELDSGLDGIDEDDEDEEEDEEEAIASTTAGPIRYKR